MSSRPSGGNNISSRSAAAQIPGLGNPAPVFAALGDETRLRTALFKQDAAMGVALGLVFALILVWTPFYGVLALINLSDNPTATMETFVGTVVVMFGIGAALTGVILMMEDL